MEGDGMSTARIIAATEAAHALEGHESDPVEARLRIAMTATHRHWMATDEGDQFAAAVAAVISVSEEPERGRLESEARNLNALQAAISGVPVDFGALETEEPIGLLRLWNEVKAS